MTDRGRAPEPPAPDAAGPPGGEAGDLCPRDPTPAELGRRIRRLRVARGLTLKDLEERGQISATHISEVERGRASPTVGALARIAHALFLRPAALVEPIVLPEISATSAKSRQARRIGLGEATLEPLTGPVEGAMLGAQLVTLPVGRGPAFSHRHEGEEWALVITGTAEARVDGRSFVLHEGDALHFRAHLEHSFANLAQSPSQLLVAARPRLSL